MLKWCVTSTRVSTALSVTMTTLGMGTEIITDKDNSQVVEYAVTENWEGPTENKNITDMNIELTVEEMVLENPEVSTKQDIISDMEEISEFLKKDEILKAETSHIPEIPLSFDASFSPESSPETSSLSLESPESPSSSPETFLSSPETSLSSPETSLSSPESPSSPGKSLSQKTVTFKENSKLCEIKVFQVAKCDYCAFEFRSKDELTKHVEMAHRKRNGARCIICLKTVNPLEHFVI